MAAAAAAAAVSGSAPPPQQNNVENLLDIDFDGTAPASAHKEPDGAMSGLDGLAGTPVRVDSPAGGAPSGSNNMDDLLGVFGDSGASSSGGAPAPPNGGGAGADLLNGFSDLDLSGNGMSSPPPASGSSQPKKTNEDIMSLF